MQRLITAILLCAYGAANIGYASEQSASASRIDSLRARLESPSAKDVMVIAHRTCWRDAAENSLAGIRECINLGVDMIEIDVRQTKDGALVLMHDNSVDRTTTGTGKVADLTLQEIQNLKLRGLDGTGPLTNYRVPTLTEALDAAKGQILVNLDIKEDLYSESLRVAKEKGMTDQVIIKMGVPAADPELVNAKFLGKTYFMPIVHECRPDSTEYCIDALANAVNEYNAFDPVAIEVVNHTDGYLKGGAQAIREAGLRLWVNTLGPNYAAGRSDDKSLLDPDGNWGYLVEIGVNMMQTDRPAELIRYLVSKGYRSGG